MRPRQFKIIPSLSDYRSTYRITNICNLNGKKSWICVLRALSKLYFEDQVFVILTQNKGSAFPKFTVWRLTPLRQLLETCFFQPRGLFQPQNEIFWKYTCGAGSFMHCRGTFVTTISLLRIRSKCNPGPASSMAGSRWPWVAVRSAARPTTEARGASRSGDCGQAEARASVRRQRQIVDVGWSVNPSGWANRALTCIAYSYPPRTNLPHLLNGSAACMGHWGSFVQK